MTNINLICIYRRLYRQLAKRICKKQVKIGFNKEAYNTHLKDLRRNLYKKKKKSYRKR